MTKFPEVTLARVQVPVVTFAASLLYWSLRLMNVPELPPEVTVPAALPVIARV